MFAAYAGTNILSAVVNHSIDDSDIDCIEYNPISEIDKACSKTLSCKNANIFFMVYNNIVVDVACYGASFGGPCNYKK